jgi:DNA processing protein
MNNSDLYRNILESGGLIISETSPRTKMTPGLFPSRNRIIAGISLGTLVVEAGEKSGSLITANLALGYGRDLFAIPSSLEDTKFTGSNRLIRDSKAKLVMDSTDILEEYGYLTNVEGNLPVEKKYLSLQEEEIYNSILSGPKLADEIAILTKKNIQEVISICSVLEIKGVITRGENNKLYIS